MTRLEKRPSRNGLWLGTLLGLVGVACGTQPGTPADAGSDTGGSSSGGAGTGGRASGGTASGGPGSECRSDSQCALAKCCGSAECFGFYCGISPSQCQTPTFECDTDADCPPDGTCVSSLKETCPQCPSRDCVYPPPLCSDGYTCQGLRVCDVASARADEHGCVAPSCADTVTCPENYRCTAPSAVDDGCRLLTCTQDADCDSGYCLNGTCSSSVAGKCTAPPP